MKTRISTRMSVFSVLAGLVAFAPLRGYAEASQEWASGNSKGRIQELEATVDSLNNRIEVQQQLIESLQSDVEEVTGIFAPPSIVFLDAVTIEEGRFLTVSVALSKPSVYRVTVDYNTVNGTAVAGQHYENSFGTLAFEPGSTVQELTVSTIDNYDSRSPTVAFQVQFSNPQFAELNTSTITASIVDTEDAPFLVFLITREAYEPPVVPGAYQRDSFTAQYQFYDGLRYPDLCRLDYSPYLYTPPEPVRISVGHDQSRLGGWPAAEPGVDFDFPDYIDLPAGVAQGEVVFGQVYDDDLVEGHEYVWVDSSRITVLGDAVMNPNCFKRVQIVDSD